MYTLYLYLLLGGGYSAVAGECIHYTCISSSVAAIVPLRVNVYTIILYLYLLLSGGYSAVAGEAVADEVSRRADDDEAHGHDPRHGDVHHRILIRVVKQVISEEEKYIIIQYYLCSEITTIQVALTLLFYQTVILLHCTFCTYCSTVGLSYCYSYTFLIIMMSDFCILLAVMVPDSRTVVKIYP